MCTTQGFTRAVRHVTGEQFPDGSKQLISLSLVDYGYIGGDWAVINQIKFRTDTCQRKAENQCQ